MTFSSKYVVYCTVQSGTRSTQTTRTKVQRLQIMHHQAGMMLKLSGYPSWASHRIPHKIREYFVSSRKILDLIVQDFNVHICRILCSISCGPRFTPSP